MVRTYNEVGKRAKKSIKIQLEKLINKYGEKSVRLVCLNILKKVVEQRKLEQEIKTREKELEQLKKRK